MAKKISKKDLKKRLKTTTSDLDEQRALTDQLQRSLAQLEERVQQAEKRLTQVETAPARKASASGGTRSSGTAARGKSAAPDRSWTVEQLRAEARKREVPGFSTKNKSGLLAALR